MPNIEIHGIVDAVKREEMKGHVFGAFQWSPFVKDIVVTTYHDACAGLIGQEVGEETPLLGYGLLKLKAMPFFRVVSTSEPYLDNVVKTLVDSFGLDVEVVILNKFVPAQLEP